MLALLRRLLALPRQVVGLLRSTMACDASDPLRVAIDKAWLYAKYGFLIAILLLNVTVITGIPHLRWQSTVHTSRTGEVQGTAEYVGPFGVKYLAAEATGPLPPRIKFIPLWQCYRD